MSTYSPRSKVCPVPGCRSSAPHYCRVYAQGAAVTGAVGRWWRGITRTGQLSGCTAISYRQPSLGVFCVPPSFIFAPAKFNYFDINFSIVKVASYLMLYLIWDLYLQPSSASINPVQPWSSVGDPNISHQNPAKHGVIICSSWAELMVSGFHFLL